METKHVTSGWSRIVWPIIALLVFASCGGGGGGLDPDLNLNPNPVPQGQWEGTVATSSSANPGFAGVPELPFDSIDHSPSTIDTFELPGSEFMQKLNAEVSGTSLVLAAPAGDDSPDDPIAYGLYKFSGLADAEPQFLNIECLPRTFGESYYVLLADFTEGEWAWFGPVTFPEFQLNLQDLNHRFVTELGNMYFMVLCGAGNGATLARSVLTLEQGGGDDGRLPGAPHHLIATDGAFDNRVVIEWSTGDGASGYELWRRLDGEHGEWAIRGETSVARFVDEEVEPGVVYVYKARSFNDVGSSGFSNHDTGFAGSIHGEDPPAGHAFGLHASKGEYLEKIELWWEVEGEYDYFEIWRRTDGSEGEFVEIGTTEALEFSDTELPGDFTFIYKVRAILGELEGPFSNTDHGYLMDRELPAAPFELHATDGTFADKVRVRWIMEGEWNYFKVFRKLVGEGTEWHLIGDVEAMEYLDFEVEQGTEYLYKAQNVFNHQESNFSNSDVGFASGENPDIPAPFELQASKGLYFEKIEVWWSFEGDYNFFEVWRRTDGHEGDFVKIGTTEVKEYIDTELPGDFTFIYKVRAIRNEHEGPFSNTDHGYLKDRENPNHPFELVASDGNYEEKVRIEWSMEGEYDSFSLWRKLDGEEFEWDLRANTEVPEFNDFDVEPGVYYIYKVYAILGEEDSEPSNTDSGYAGSVHGPGDPFGLVATDGTYEDKVRLEWGMEGDFNSFQVWRKRDGGEFEWDDIATTEVQSYNDLNVDPGVIYVYKVIAVLNEQHSDPSNIDTGYAGSLHGLGHPFELFATDGTYDEKVRLEWGMEGDYDHFQVWRKRDGEGFEWDDLATTEVPEYDDFAVDRGVHYLYKVYAVLGEEVSDPSNVDSGYAE